MICFFFVRNHNELDDCGSLHQKLIVLLYFSFIDKTSGAIKCYECTVIPQRRSNETAEKLCSKFEETDYFEVNCPYSTMCKKRTYRLKLLNGEEQETTERSCANQRHEYMVLIFPIYRVKLFSI